MVSVRLGDSTTLQRNTAKKPFKWDAPNPQNGVH